MRRLRGRGGGEAVTTTDMLMDRGAELSECGHYRYSLWRIWDTSKPPVLFIGLNPSTADATTDDPTIRRCIRFASDWGAGGLMMGNLFAYRATAPDDMKAQSDPIGPDNNRHLLRLARRSHPVVCAWGADGDWLERWMEVAKLLGRDDIHPWCLGLTKSGQPRHPLYIRADQKLQPYRP